MGLGSDEETIQAGSGSLKPVAGSARQVSDTPANEEVVSDSQVSEGHHKNTPMSDRKVSDSQVGESHQKNTQVGRVPDVLPQDPAQAPQEGIEVSAGSSGLITRPAKRLKVTFVDDRQVVENIVQMKDIRRKGKK